MKINSAIFLINECDSEYKPLTNILQKSTDKTECFFSKSQVDLSRDILSLD
ncbi:MAG TPA: hypothetical protein VGZ69_02965 [Candidatus Rhabdochlamydia sp.]|jgi:hypothetical protein|nr:hypothetical protein [Candidatus Rhabdochlamydia sp.]